MKVAIIDDERDMRLSISQWLSLSGYEPESFASAEDALASINSNYPGVVISDIKMPGMDGIKLLKKLMGQDSQLPVILITGHGEQPASKFSKDAQDVAKDMKKKDVKKFASTKHKGLPMKKEIFLQVDMEN